MIFVLEIIIYFCSNWKIKDVMEFSQILIIRWQYPKVGELLGMLDFSYISLPSLAKRRSLSSQMKKLRKIMKWLMKTLLWFNLLGELREHIICSIALYPFFCLCSWMHYFSIPHLWYNKWHDTWLLPIFFPPFVWVYICINNLLESFDYSNII